MPRLSELAKKTKSRAKKDDKKRKTPPADDDVTLSDPVVPKIPAQEALSIKEPTTQAPSQPLPVEGKGKGTLVEPSRPPKKPRTIKDMSLPVMPANVPEAAKTRTLKTQFHAELHANAGDAGLTMATD